jgi:hypothetical protein
MRKTTRSALALALATAGLLHSAETFTFEVRAVDLNGVAANEEERADGDFMWKLRQEGSIVGTHHAQVPASTLVTIPANGDYFLWVFYQVAKNRRKSFAVHLGEQEVIFVAEPYGEETQTESEHYAKGFLWTREPITLEAGDITLLLKTNPKLPDSGRKADPLHPPVVRSLFLTNDLHFVPSIPY